MHRPSLNSEVMDAVMAGQIGWTSNRWRPVRGQAGNVDRGEEIEKSGNAEEKTKQNVLGD